MSDFSPKDLSLVHVARPPRALVDGKPPLLLLLHGVGSNERDLLSFADVLDPRLLVLSLRAPLVRGPESFAWFTVEFLPTGFKIDPEQLRASRDAIVRFLGEAVEAYDVNPERVYLLGFSQGAIMALTTALSTPAPIAGIVPLSGRIPPEVLPWMAPKEQLAGLPVLMIHGTRDAVIGVSHARQAYDILRELPVALVYQEFEMGHEVTPRVLKVVLGWLKARLDEPRRRRNDAASS
jgi:phospholipase/carboxylesterase